MFSKENSYLSVTGLIVVFLLSLVTVITSSVCAKASEADRVANLIEGAKKEGRISIYTGDAVTSVNLLIKQFNIKYPFIKTEVYRAGAARLVVKVMAEANAGTLKADVIGTEGLTGYLMMKKGLFAKYMSPESKTYPKESKDPEGYWTSVYNNYKVIAYNTRLVPPKDVPRAWEDLLQPKWKGKILFADNNYEWFGNMLKIMGDEKGMAFMKRLAAQKLALRTGNTLTVTLIVAGERSIGIPLNADAIEEVKAKGASIDWVGAEPILSRLHILAVTRNATNPNAAKLWVDFILSREGQEIVTSNFRIPARPDVKPFAPRFSEPIKLTTADLSLADNYEEITRKCLSVFK